jgi:hypothetical protein
MLSRSEASWGRGGRPFATLRVTMWGRVRLVVSVIDAQRLGSFAALRMTMWGVGFVWWSAL